MSRHPETDPSRMPSPGASLEQQILAVELRMVQRRRALFSAWNEVEHVVGQVLAPRAWLWPLALGTVGGCLLGLLWCRGDRGRAGARAWVPRGASSAARAPGAGDRAGVQALLGPWLRSLLAPLLQQWLRPALLEAAEALLLALLAGALRTKPAARRGRQAGPVPPAAGEGGPTTAEAPERPPMPQTPRTPQTAQAPLAPD